MSSSSSILPDPPVTRREVFAWASLDFANSGYTTVVLTAVFNAYFVSVVMDDVAHATLVWTLVLSASYLVVMFSAPFLGAYADAHRAKRPLLLVATLLCGAATLGLTQCGPGDLWPAAALLLVSNVAYATHQDLSAGFMRSLAGPGALGRLSGWGWAWGYLGGLLTLGLSLVWVSSGGPGCRGQPHGPGPHGRVVGHYRLGLLAGGPAAWRCSRSASRRWRWTGALPGPGCFAAGVPKRMPWAMASMEAPLGSFYGPWVLPVGVSR